MNQRGITYLEVLIAAALLSIVMMPVLSGFFNAMQNQRYARAAYEASLYAANLLTEAGEGVMPGGGGLASALGNPAFDDEYKTDAFDYRLSVYEHRAGGLTLSFTAATDNNLPAAPAPVFDGYAYPIVTAARVIDSSVAVYSLAVDGNTDIFVTGDHALFIECENTSAAHTLLNIYAPYPERVIVSGTGLTVILSKPLPVERVIMSEIYDKNGMPLNRLALPVVWRTSP
jgi:type II secretory pathway pseudopilin PulG